MNHAKRHWHRRFSAEGRKLRRRNRRGDANTLSRVAGLLIGARKSPTRAGWESPDGQFVGYGLVQTLGITPGQIARWAKW